MGTDRSGGRRLVGRVTLVAAALAAAVSAAPAGANPGTGLVLPRGAAPAVSALADPHLLYHGGPILTQTAVTAIFWGRSWSKPGFAGDKITGLDSFYTGVGGTQYMQSNVEYTGSNGRAGAGVSYSGHLVDTSTANSRAPRARNTSVLLKEVAKMISNPVANGYYPVYTDIRRNGRGFCAWHSWGNVRGVTVQFGFFFAVDGDPGCDPVDPSSVHSQGLEALANISGHELSETVTDPLGTGWWDAAGYENSDKCAWSFAGSVPFSNGTSWKIQGNWSNIAFDANSGFPNQALERGCLVTHA